MPAKNRGFTLIELLVVISIVALLTSLAIVAMNNARRDSRDTKRMADIKQIANALELYFEKWNRYPWNASFMIGGYDENDFTDYDPDPPPQGMYLWDSSCGANNPNDPFLTPLKDAGIMLNLPDDPLFRKDVNCYVYTSYSYHVQGWYINGYYLVAKMENPDNVQNNCDINIYLTDPSQPNQDRFCIMNKH